MEFWTCCWLWGYVEWNVLPLDFRLCFRNEVVASIKTKINSEAIALISIWVCNKRLSKNRALSTTKPNNKREARFESPEKIRQKPIWLK